MMVSVFYVVYIYSRRYLFLVLTLVVCFVPAMYTFYLFIEHEALACFCSVPLISGEQACEGFDERRASEATRFGSTSLGTACYLLLVLNVIGLLSLCPLHPHPNLTLPKPYPNPAPPQPNSALPYPTPTLAYPNPLPQPYPNPTRTLLLTPTPPYPYPTPPHPTPTPTLPQATLCPTVG